MDNIVIQQELLDHLHNPIYFLFGVTAAFLQILALIPKTDYQFWNIIIWFGFVPASWIYLLSIKTSKWMNVLSILLLSYIFWYEQYHFWFDLATEFLNYLVTQFGSNYIYMSVYVCDFLPIAVYAILIYFCCNRKWFRVYVLGLLIMSVLLAVLFFVSPFLIEQFVQPV